MGNGPNDGHIGVAPVVLFGIPYTSQAELYLLFFIDWIYDTPPTVPLPACMPPPRNLRPKAMIEIRIGLDQSYNRASIDSDNDGAPLEPGDLNPEDASSIFDDEFSDLGFHLP